MGANLQFLTERKVMVYLSISREIEMTLQYKSVSIIYSILIVFAFKSKTER